ncbi:hypothetical protein QHH11_23760 [Aphanizomenon sp. PH219]|nr:hypothetical protein [Aphanizomenon sp. 202]MDK2462103.1 hypothetical protein [Aphanizomenon sp. PH219]MDM3845295.1 hypothetical protein [Aphanizomenon gracile PMC638.10]MDM3859769.1 hypothetical protein [Aphanizomenon gracile PMC644.10]
MSDILFDDVPVEQQETVVGGESFSYYSFSRTNGKELTKEEREEWLKKIWAVNESSSFKRLLRLIFN